jgi:hypothetical protein
VTVLDGRESQGIYKPVVSVLARALECSINPPLDLRAVDVKASWSFGRKIWWMGLDAQSTIFAFIADDCEP